MILFSRPASVSSSLPYNSCKLEANKKNSKNKITLIWISIARNANTDSGGQHILHIGP